MPKRPHSEQTIVSSLKHYASGEKTAGFSARFPFLAAPGQAKVSAPTFLYFTCAARAFTTSLISSSGTNLATYPSAPTFFACDSFADPESEE